MKDINEVASSTVIRKLVKRQPAEPALPRGGEMVVAANGANKTAAAPDTVAFDAHERELLQNSPQEDLAGLANLKKVFPGSIVRAVEASPADEPVSDAERKALEMEAHLKEVCRRRNLAFADIDRLWPSVEKRRRQQQREERERKL
ncbi:MAG: hypothetical protein WC687_04400 [Patescibacteria group bacterium]|jgi:hypothetical protein